MSRDKLVCSDITTLVETIARYLAIIAISGALCTAANRVLGRFSLK